MSKINTVPKVLACAFTILVFVGLMTPVYAQTFTVHQVEQQCGDFDLVFAVDNTGSMGPAIANVNAGLQDIIDQAVALQFPGSDLRLGLLTFKDDVTVLEPLTTDTASVEASLAGIVASAGGNDPEASDMAKETAIKASDGAPATDAEGNAGTVNGDFNVEWVQGPFTGRVLVLVTDAPPGGFDDAGSATDDTHLASLGTDAAGKNIAVLDIFVPDIFSNDGSTAFMMEDAANSAGGFYAESNADGTGTAQDIIDFIATNPLCNPPPVGGEFLPIDSTALFLAGIQSSAIWMLPAIAGAAGAGAYYIRTRMNKD